MANKRHIFYLWRIAISPPIIATIRSAPMLVNNRLSLVVRNRFTASARERVLHIDHLFARMRRLNPYEVKTNAMTRIGSNFSQVLPPPFSCE